MRKTNEAKRAHGQREVVAAKSRRHPGLFRQKKTAAGGSCHTEHLEREPALVRSACRAARTGLSASGPSDSNGVSPPTGSTMKECGPCRSTRPSHTFIPEAGTKRSTALTCVTRTSVCSSVRRRPRC